MDKITYLKNTNSKRQSYAYCIQKIGEDYSEFFISVFSLRKVIYEPTEESKNLSGILKTFENKNEEKEPNFLISLN